MQNTLSGLFRFLDEGISPFHAVRAAEQRLQDAGYQKLEESTYWTLYPGGKYYTTRNQSSVIAWHIPESGTITGWHAAVSHSDAPTWRLKNTAGTDKFYAKAGVEGYGGMIMYSWLDRPLSLAGRLMVRTERGLESKLVSPQMNLMCIPSVAIHFNREVNKGFAFNPHVDMRPIFGESDADLMYLLRREAGCANRDDIVGYDLTLYVRQNAQPVGMQGEWFMAPRIDDLECAYTTLMGFLAARAEEPGRVDLWAMLDNEEVGSSSRQGASGTFTADVMARIEDSIGLSREQSVAARANSLLLSADNGHAVHPNHPEKSDADHPVVMNGGVVLKYNASQKYSTSGFTGALFKEICLRAEVPFQTFVNRADMPGGSTLGNLLSHQVSIPMVDIGLGQLAMHSAVETAGCVDVEYMIRAVSAFYNTVIRQSVDGSWTLE